MWHESQPENANRPGKRRELAAGLPGRLLIAALAQRR